MATLPQIASRVFLTWGILFSFPQVSNFSLRNSYWLVFVPLLKTPCPMPTGVVSEHALWSDCCRDFYLIAAVRLAVVFLHYGNRSINGSQPLHSGIGFAVSESNPCLTFENWLCKCRWEITGWWLRWSSVGVLQRWGSCTVTIFITRIIILFRLLYTKASLADDPHGFITNRLSGTRSSVWKRRSVQHPAFFSG